MALLTGLRPSIEYIPEELRGEDLYQTSTLLIDAVRQRPNIDLLADLDETVKDLLGNYEDRRAVLAYYNMYVRPFLGTRSSLLLVLRLLEIDAEMVEWFNADFNLPPYKFSLDFADYPTTLNVDRLIDLVARVKNERSRLAVIRQKEGFQDLLQLDNSNLDDSLLGDVSGEEYRGVNIFLSNRRRSVVEIPSPVILQETYEVFTSIFEMSYADWRLDYLVLGDTVEYPALVANRGSSSTTNLIDLTEYFHIFERHSEEGEDFFTLDRSILDGYDFLGLTVRDFVTDEGEYDETVKGYLDVDLYLDEMLYGDIYVQYNHRLTDIPSLFNLEVKALTHITETHSQVYDYPEQPAITSILDVHDSTVYIPRYGIGEPVGTTEEYKVSIYSNHRQE